MPFHSCESLQGASRLWFAPGQTWSVDEVEEIEVRKSKTKLTFLADLSIERFGRLSEST